MTLGLAVAIVLATAGATILVTTCVAPLLRIRCPWCSARRLAFLPATGRDSLFARYRCGDCATHWVACGRGLVSREAFAAGARDPLPAATLRRS